MRILMIGDIVGKPGYRLVADALMPLREARQLDLVIANGENSADGSGITPRIYRVLTAAGVDCITLGDHIFRRKQIIEILETKDNILKPANYPATSPGRGWTVVESAQGVKVGVISLLGRVFMRPVDCPWTAVERVLAEMPDDVKIRMVDFHAEATSDKQLMGRFLDGRVTAVLGTHTHVATADEQIMAGGTAFQCDVGMSGPHNGILGREYDPVIATTREFTPNNFDVARGDVRICGSIVDVDEATGLAVAIERLVLTHQAGMKLKDEFAARKSEQQPVEP